MPLFQSMCPSAVKWESIFLIKVQWSSTKLYFIVRKLVLKFEKLSLGKMAYKNSWIPWLAFGHHPKCYLILCQMHFSSSYISLSRLSWPGNKAHHRNRAKVYGNKPLYYIRILKDWLCPSFLLSYTPVGQGGTTLVSS